MATPIRLAVLLDLQAALRAINGGAEYHNTIESADDVAADPSRNILGRVGRGTLQILVVPLTDKDTREFEPANQINETIWFQIMAAKLTPAGAEGGNTRVTELEQIAADIERALTRDIRRGGLRQTHPIFLRSDSVASSMSVVITSPTPGIDPLNCLSSA